MKNDGILQTKVMVVTDLENKTHLPFLKSQRAEQGLSELARSNVK